MRIVRWILVAPAAVAAWYATFFLGIFVYSVVEKTCPEGQMLSESCQNANALRLLEGVIFAFITLSAVAVVGAAAAMAPAYEAAVSWVAFGVGALVAAHFAIATQMYGAGTAAAFAGLGTAAVITRQSNQRALHLGVFGTGETHAE